MIKKENLYTLSIIIFIILITFKIWIKLTFEVQVLGLIVLVAISWTLKYVIFKYLKRRVALNEAKKERDEDLAQ